MAKLTVTDVLRLAQLSKIQLDEKELVEFSDELTKILDYVDLLATVNVDGLLPTAQVTGLTNVLRPDELVDYDVTPEQLLKNAPAVENNQIKVKRVLG
jgi:aspartyl-tRNA(Asn)/glutamyl-tRNA(Gln) amidotransferase subunit C